jgi:hypothetical protein
LPASRSKNPFLATIRRQTAKADGDNAVDEIAVAAPALLEAIEGTDATPEAPYSEQN